MKKYLVLHRREVVTVVFLLMIIELFTVLGSVINAHILNSLVAMKIQQFMVNIGLFLLDWIVVVSVRYLESIYQEKVIQNIDTSIRADVVNMLIKENYETYNSKSANTYESWINNDIQTINEQGFRRLFTVIEGLLGAVLALVVLVTFHWSLAVTALIFSAIILISPRLFNQQLKKQNTAFTHENEQFVKQTSDYLSAFNLLYTFNSLKLLLKKVVSASNDLGGAFINRSRIQSKVAATGFLGNVIAQILLTGLTGVLVINKLVTVGTLNAVSSLSGNIFNNLGNMSNYLGMIRGTDPIFNKYKLESQLVNDSDTRHPILEGKTHLNEDSSSELINLNDVSFSYKSGGKILNQVSLGFKARQKYLILGPSGCGKSTLLKLIAGYVLPTSGTVLFCGRNLQLLNTQELHRQILYLDQNPHMLSATVRENLNLDDHYTDNRLIESLKEVKLVTGKKDGIRLLNKSLRGSQGLSGGQVQRLALARGLLRHPRIVLLDEGTSAVDKQTAIDIERFLLLNTNLTLIMVSHTLHQATLKLFDKKLNFNGLIRRQSK